MKSLISLLSTLGTIILMCSMTNVNPSPAITGMSSECSNDTTKIRIAEKDLADKKDPVCGMPAFKFLADTAVADKKVYGFCSKSCKSRFVKNPKAYLKTKK
ncbi:hypothetical protein [Pedobacter cryoconitis]|uniref:hypothetical protein n=1 Tax=Pedobacter cryoconitis TaxID=188932 RepID=UPI001608A03F|nr:hypothetical protein [Pedobacter cryoconitis]MBB5645725.1 YHS domain-containing protein [Pedobacter cryoconitis]